MMFCLYSSCSPSAYLPLQRPMPLWAAPTITPIGSEVPLGQGLRGQPDLSEERRMEIGGREGGLPPNCRGKGVERLSQDPGRPSFFLRGTGPPGKRARCDSPGRSIIVSPLTHSPPGLQSFNDKYPSDVDSPFCEKSPASFERWETPASPASPSRNHSGSKDSRIEKEQEDGEEDGAGDAEEEFKRMESTDRHQNHIVQNVRPSSEISSAVVMATVSIGNKWSTTSPFASPRRRPDSAAAIQRRNHLPSPVARSVPSPTSATATKHVVLKFGIDSILRNKDTHQVSSDKVIQQHQLPTNHQQQHRHSHHHPLGPPPPRSHPPLLNIPQSKPHGGNHGPVIGSNFILTSPAVYSPHLYALQGQLHFSHPPTHPHPPCSSSSSSSSASPASVHLRPNVLPPPPAMHYSLHHPFHISSRHSEFSGSTFGLLGSSSDLHSPHLHPHSKKKRSWSRAVFSNLQRKGLEKRFEVQKYVTKPDRRQLAAMLGLTDAQVKVWFQNRRMKWRHQEEAMKKKETDPRKPPSQPAPPPSRMSPPDADDNSPELAGVEPDYNNSHRPIVNHLAAESDDEGSLSEDISSANAQLSSRDVSDGLLSSRDPIDGRIRVSDAADDAGNRSNGIMSVADILDLRKESVTCTTIDNGDNDEDDDDDDDISIISASI